MSRICVDSESKKQRVWESVVAVKRRCFSDKYNKLNGRKEALKIEVIAGLTINSRVDKAMLKNKELSEWKRYDFVLPSMKKG